MCLCVCVCRGEGWGKSEKTIKMEFSVLGSEGNVGGHVHCDCNDKTVLLSPAYVCCINIIIEC